MPALVSERELSFLLFECLDLREVLGRPRCADGSAEVVMATLDTARLQ